MRLSSPQALEPSATASRPTPRPPSPARASSDEQLFREGLIAESRLQASRANAAQSAAQAAERAQELRLAQHSGGQTLSLVAPIAGSVLEQQASVGQRVEQSAPLPHRPPRSPVVDIQAPLAIASQLRGRRAPALRILPPAPAAR